MSGHSERGAGLLACSRAVAGGALGRCELLRCSAIVSALAKNPLQMLLSCEHAWESRLI